MSANNHSTSVDSSLLSTAAAASLELVVTPEPVITGVTGVELGSVSACIDWLAYTVPWPLEVRKDVSRFPLSALVRVAHKQATMPLEAFSLSGEASQNRNGYSVSVALSIGGVMRFNPDRLDMGIHVELRGEDLRMLRLADVEGEDLLRFVCGVPGARISRLDLALNWYGAGSPLDMLTAWQAGTVNTAVRDVAETTSHSPDGVKGSTVYFGSVSSERRLRVYDKRAEQGAAFPWLRVELVSKNEYAWQAAEAVLNADLISATRAAMRAFVWTDAVQWYCDALTGADVTIEPVTRKLTDTDRWLQSTVLPTLRRRLRELCDTGDDWLLIELRDIVTDCDSNSRLQKTV